MKTRGGFTLIELLVVIAIIGLLMSILLPVLGRARMAGQRTACLSNIRNLEIAHWMYMESNNGYFVNAGLAHGGSTAFESRAWINTLQKYYSNRLLLKSPVDRSPHWSREDGGDDIPVPGTTDQFRRSSYGINNYLSDFAPFKAYRNLSQIRQPAVIVQFLIMSFEGAYAGSDHPHVESWWAFPPQPQMPPVWAAGQVQTNAYGGKAETWEAISGYGFLDGHAEAQKFEDVYTNYKINKFDPEAAQ
jgi:prepilin-type N-terminal cleavage/methylation domain-containing protein